MYNTVVTREYTVYNFRCVHDIFGNMSNKIIILYCLFCAVSDYHKWADCTHVQTHKRKMTWCLHFISKRPIPLKLRSINRPKGEPYVLYGDPAYGLSRNILSPFYSHGLSLTENAFNRAMSSVRVSVELTLGKLVQYFAYLDFKKNQKILFLTIGKYYLVGASLPTAILVCMVQLQPPSLVCSLLLWQLIY